MQTEQPIETAAHVGTPHESVESRHPAYGLVSVMRHSNGRDHHLFGSDVPQPHSVVIRVETAVAERKLGREWNRGEKIAFEFELSESQFARMVSSHGMGEGTPCTLRIKESGGLVQVPGIDPIQRPRAELHGEELEKDLREAVGGIATIVEKLKKMTTASGSVSKTEMKVLLHDAEVLCKNLPKDAAHSLKQFRTASETTVEALKVDIESFVNSVATRTGLDALRERQVDAFQALEGSRPAGAAPDDLQVEATIRP